MKKRLNWQCFSIACEIREYRAVFEEEITDSISFFISYCVYKDVTNNKWCLLITQVFPNSLTLPVIKECNNPDTGRKMAEKNLQEILDGMQKILSKYK